MNLPPTPVWDAGQPPQAGPRVPPRFVPTLTDVLPAPLAMPATGAEAMPQSPSEATAPGEHVEPPFVLPLAEVPPSQPPGMGSMELQSLLRERILAELMVALPAWVDAALAPRLHEAVALAMPELHARLREQVQSQVARALDDAGLSRTGLPTDA